MTRRHALRPVRRSMLLPSHPWLFAVLGAGLVPPTVHVPAPTGTYGPFVHHALDLVEESGMLMHPYAVPDELRVLEGARGAQLTVRSFCTDKLRQGRVLLLDGGPSLQVLNICLFPRLDLPLPTFSADLVTLPGGSLVAIDCQPNGVPPRPCAHAEAALDAAFARHRPRLPDGGRIPPDTARFFSPRFLWSRLPAEMSAVQIQELLLPAFEDYLRAYLCARPPQPAPTAKRGVWAPPS